ARGQPAQLALDALHQRRFGVARSLAPPLQQLGDVVAGRRPVACPARIAQGSVARVVRRFAKSHRNTLQFSEDSAAPRDASWRVRMHTQAREDALRCTRALRSSRRTAPVARQSLEETATLRARSAPGR